jgi:hypothetical protein
MNITKMAAKDAAEWARAEMFFGEGAGTRRKLLEAEIGHKVENISDYSEAFNKAYESQNMADHAIKAAKERKHIDRMEKVSKNTRALVRGDRRGFSTGVAIIFAVGYVAHQTGYDKVALEKGKKYYSKIRYRIAFKKYQRDSKKWNASKEK